MTPNVTKLHVTTIYVLWHICRHQTNLCMYCYHEHGGFVLDYLHETNDVKTFINGKTTPYVLITTKFVYKFKFKSFEKFSTHIYSSSFTINFFWIQPFWLPYKFTLYWSHFISMDFGLLAHVFIMSNNSILCM
jgi:hypothetical protein